MAENVDDVLNNSENQMDDKKEEKENIFDVTECNCVSVVVYLDRAEVCRSVKPILREGENEVVLTNLSSFLDKDSIRVEGKGPATISEVSFQTRHLGPKEENESTDKAAGHVTGKTGSGRYLRKELRKQVEEKRTKEGVLQTKSNRLKKQRQVLDNFADNVSKAPGHGTYGGKGEEPKRSGSIPLNEDTLKGMDTFFNLFDSQASKLDEAIFEVEQEIKVVGEERMAIERNLQEMRAKIGKKQERIVSILLDVKEETKVELNVSYVVTHAKWTPKYDIRVFSTDQEMKISYYGMIQQSTGEDWENAKLSLSTAIPSIGGTVPELGTQKLRFRPKIQPMNYGTPAMQRSIISSALRAPPPAPPPPGAAAMMMMSEASPPPPPPPMTVPTAEVRDSITSAVFEVARLSSIPADNVEHKVAVAIIDFKPDFQFECVPKKSTFAYLKAKVRNTSQYALLAGPSNIFLDNNFISKAELKGVSPGEEFDCSLGIDPTIKVMYKPVHKFHEQTGLWNKSQNIKYKQVIEVKNNHQYEIKLMLSDQLPLSTDDKIKVHLTEPVIKKEPADKGEDRPKTPPPVRLNKKNNVEWDLTITAGSTREIVLRYTVEHPINEEIDVMDIPVPS